MRPGSHAGVLRNHDGLLWLKENIKLQKKRERDPFGGSVDWVRVGVGGVAHVFV